LMPRFICLRMILLIIFFFFIFFNSIIFHQSKQISLFSSTDIPNLLDMPTLDYITLDKVWKAPMNRMFGNPSFKPSHFINNFSLAFYDAKQAKKRFDFSRILYLLRNRTV
jgi:hypothetical protein